MAHNALIYCRASTAEQHADRALGLLREFASERGWPVRAVYIENASGARLARPELMRLLGEAEAGDVLLVESIDRLSRLTQKEWATLKQRIQDKGLVIVAVHVDAAGVPQEVRLTQSSGFDRLDRAALAGVRRARFKPYTEGGQPTAGWARIPIPFELEN